MAKKLSLTFDTEEMARVVECKILMPVADIKNKQECRKYTKLLDSWLEFKKGIQNKRAKEILSDIIEATAKKIEDYEISRSSLNKKSPTEALKSFKEDFNLTQEDLAKYLGTQSIVSEVLNGKRSISLEAAKKLAKRFSVSPLVFLEI